MNFDKKWVGLKFGRFFLTNSSGHPGGEREKKTKLILTRNLSYVLLVNLQVITLRLPKARRNYVNLSE
jgi:hypothetical protein